MFGLRSSISRRILPNINSLSGCCRFIKKGNSPSGSIIGRLHGGTFHDRTYASTVDLTKEPEIHGSEVHAGPGKRQKKSRPSAAKTSLRRAALEAQISQHKDSGSIFRPQEVTGRSKVYKSLPPKKNLMS